METSVVDIDSSSAPTFTLDAGTPSAVETPVPQGTETPQKPDGQGKVEPQKTEVKAGEPDPDVIIELKRSEREHKGRASKAEERLKTVEPVLELLRTAKDDPARFLSEIADIVGMTPERAMEAMATAGAGGTVELTADDKIARLERELAELKNPKPAPSDVSPEAKAAHDNELATAGAVLEAAAAAYPLSAKEPSAAQAAFLVRVRHWETNGKAADGTAKPGYKPLSYAQAFAQVEAALQRRAGAPQSQAGQPANPTPQSNPGGLSNSNTGAVVPGDPNRILTDEEIRADLLRTFAR